MVAKGRHQRVVVAVLAGGCGDEARGAAADMAAHPGKVPVRQAEIGEGEVETGSDAGKAVDQGAVEVEDYEPGVVHRWSVARS